MTWPRPDGPGERGAAVPARLSFLSMGTTSGAGAAGGPISGATSCGEARGSTCVGAVSRPVDLATRGKRAPSRRGRTISPTYTAGRPRTPPSTAAASVAHAQRTSARASASAGASPVREEGDPILPEHLRPSPRPTEPLAHVHASTTARDARPPPSLTRALRSTAPVLTHPPSSSLAHPLARSPTRTRSLLPALLPGARFPPAAARRSALSTLASAALPQIWILDTTLTPRSTPAVLANRRGSPGTSLGHRKGPAAPEGRQARSFGG